MSQDKQVLVKQSQSNGFYPHEGTKCQSCQSSQSGGGPTPLPRRFFQPNSTGVSCGSDCQCGSNCQCGVSLNGYGANRMQKQLSKAQGNCGCGGNGTKQSNGTRKQSNGVRKQNGGSSAQCGGSSAQCGGSSAQCGGSPVGAPLYVQSDRFRPLAYNFDPNLGQEVVFAPVKF